MWPTRPTTPRLATVIAKAKATNMPNDNIKRVLEKAGGAGQGDSYETITYGDTARAASPSSSRP